MDYISAKKNLLSGKIYSDWFKENNYILEYGYSLLLIQQPKEANKIFESISNFDIRADWAKKIIPLITRKTILEEPTFLQVRNFLELDLDMLIQSKNFNYAMNLISQGEYFYEICRESFKFIGRVLYYNNYKDLALKFFLNSKDKFYNDPELHYLLASLYLDKNEKEKGEHEIKACLNIIPEYLPAQKLLKKIEKI